MISNTIQYTHVHYFLSILSSGVVWSTNAETINTSTLFLQQEYATMVFSLRSDTCKYNTYTDFMVHSHVVSTCSLITPVCTVIVPVTQHVALMDTF